MILMSFDLNADPRLWKNLFDKNKHFRRLTVCLAHAGGGIYEYKEDSGESKYEYGWFSKDQLEWDAQNKHYAKGVVDLCNNKDYPNVYCDLSIMSEVCILIKDILNRKKHAEDLTATSIAC